MRVNVLEKDLPVIRVGEGNIPLLIFGQATFFLKNIQLFPEQFNRLFTMYFVDVFMDVGSIDSGYTSLTLDDFVAVMHSVQQQLGLEKVAVFAHSALGVLAIEYGRKHPEAVLFNLLVASSPTWGSYKQRHCEFFFRDNSTAQRKAVFASDQRQLNEKLVACSGMSKDQKFIAGYCSRRAHFFYHPETLGLEKMWEQVPLDMALIDQYFSLLMRYDINKGCQSDVPTFLALGLYDYSAPFYFWTDDCSDVFRNFTSYIFESSGHYPMKEEADLFYSELLLFMKKSSFLSGSAPMLYM